jgi:rubrerythrin
MMPSPMMAPSIPPTEHSEPMSPEIFALLHDARAAEKEQALFYRALAAAAEHDGRDDARHDARHDARPDAGASLSERLNGLHADEQHHLSRLTARLVELNEPVAELDGTVAPAVQLDGWEQVARARELAEIERYTALLATELDDRTRAMIEQFLSVERSHADELGGKWMGAES